MKREGGLGKFLKDYFGLLPIVGGMFTSGLTSTAVFLIALLYNLSKGYPQLFTGNWDYVSIAYKKAGEIAGQWILPSYAAGQFLTYRMKKTITSLFKR